MGSNRPSYIRLSSITVVLFVEEERSVTQLLASYGHCVLRLFLTSSIQEYPFGSLPPVDTRRQNRPILHIHAVKQ